MPITATLEPKHKPESVPAARDVMRRALHDTRAFHGNLGTDVLVDQDDQTHWIIYQRWETVEHDEAYRNSRAGESQPNRAASTARRTPGQNEVQHYRRVTPWHRRRDRSRHPANTGRRPTGGEQ